MDSPIFSWTAVDSGVDPLRLARLLRKAHELALIRGESPSILRSVVASSWRRAAEEGVDPDGYAPIVLDEPKTERALAAHPVSPYLPLIRQMLAEATGRAEYFAVLADRQGMLLWIDGPPKALDIAVGPGFLPGHLCSEGALGTNAVGTALALDHAVQIFSAEHFNRRLHALTCAAAPIRDPETGSTIGVLNLSGNFRTNHSHSLPLVSAVARVVEHTLARDLERSEAELRLKYFESLASSSTRSALLTSTGRVLAATPRGWLGSRVSIGADGRPLLPPGVELSDERIDARSSAFLVRASRRIGNRRPAKIEMKPLGSDRLAVSIGEWHTQLSPRHSQLLLLLATHPAGLSAEQLRILAYGAGSSRVTVRAEMSRLRRLLGPVLRGNPYRLEAEVDGANEALAHLLDPPAADPRP